MNLNWLSNKKFAKNEVISSISVLWHDNKEMSEYSGGDEINEEKIAQEVNLQRWFTEAAINKSIVVET